MAHSLRESLLEHTSSRRKVDRILTEYTKEDDILMTKRQIGKIIDQHFSRKRDREEDEEYEDEEVTSTPLNQLECLALNALTYMYSQTDRNDPYSRILYDKMRNVAERIEPSEIPTDQSPTIDTVVNMTDRIRHFFPNYQDDVPKETLFEIGRLAKEYHVDYYEMPPSKTKRIINGEEKWINVYTEETAPNTLDRAIREVMSK